MWSDMVLCSAMEAVDFWAVIGPLIGIACLAAWGSWWQFDKLTSIIEDPRNRISTEAASQTGFIKRLPHTKSTPGGGSHEDRKEENDEREQEASAGGGADEEEGQGQGPEELPAEAQKVDELEHSGSYVERPQREEEDLESVDVEEARWPEEPPPPLETPAAGPTPAVTPGPPPVVMKTYRPATGEEVVSEIKREVFESSRDTLLNRLSMRLFKRRVGVTSFDWEVPYREISFLRKIGQGSYGSVYKGEWMGMRVAIKAMNDPKKEGQGKRNAEKFVQEIAIMTTLHHPNIVLFLGACIERSHPLIVMEYLPVDLFRLLRSDVELDLIIKHRLCADIARGMKYLHRRVNLIQRDLKSKNILLDENLNGKICDFGLSRHYQEDGNMTFCGTPYWTAPEIIRQEQYSEKADVYSYSIVVWEIMTKQELYGGGNGMDVAYAAAERGLRPDIPAHIPAGYADHMQRCWDDDQHRRPGFTEVLDELHGLRKHYEDLMMPGHQAVKRVKAELGLGVDDDY